MSETVVIALLSFLGTICGAWMGVRQANRLTDWRIKQLEVKVDKHNNFVERLTVVEQRSKSNTHRLNALDGGKEGGS